MPLPKSLFSLSSVYDVWFEMLTVAYHQCSRFDFKPLNQTI